MTHRPPAVSAPWLVCLAVALSCGCSDVDLDSQAIAIDVTWEESRGYPDQLEMGSVVTGTSDTAEVVVANTGGGAFSVGDVGFALQSSELFEDGEPVALAPGESTAFEVRFTPLQPGEGTNTLEITSGATEQPVQVRVTTAAEGDPLPDIYVDPPEYDFGSVATYHDASWSFTVGNAGFVTLDVQSVEILDDDDEAYSVIFDDCSLESLDEQTCTVGVLFQPLAVASYSAALVVRSNDPDEPALEIALAGDGSVHGGEGPVALCHAEPDPAAPLADEATWIGHDSFAMGGSVLVGYTWTLLSRPEGSQAALACTGTPDCGPFVPDLAGTYTAQLVVTDQYEQSDECVAALEAVPDRELWVEVYWSLAADDLDLHLIAPGGEPFSYTDCYWATCQWSSPDWGEAGDATDDPSLDLDDIPGLGPEVISIEAAAPGTYTVMVHDENGTNLGEPDPDPMDNNETTVRVYVDGALVFSESRAVVGEGTELDFCAVELPAGLVTSL